MSRPRASAVVLVGALALGVGAAGCGGGGDEGAKADLAATGAWSRPTPATADEAVVYLTLTVDRTDALVGASVPATVAGAVELHEGMVGGEGGGHHGGGGGGGDMATMAPVERFDLEPAEPLAFEPGGNHLMLVDLVEPLVAGDAYPLTLELESGRTVEVEVPVQANPPG